ncbi:DNA-binding transcriptional regulator, AcrR family [Saccharicrinis carchari]|uniref:DNA-binding transcriptional regulator, AcrR family n=1 Tax=Saccharicrinis carchari TaxID=1168039 RepID=A0A521ELF5_SACCC|nr:TetR family transcriptional regulator C-terminal domain-containing protein [Saccharicrinis carchari]SMO84748.1 DNA-binding transcriptional regulator, AcrR family [Saccharicrinis carchari]
MEKETVNSATDILSAYMKYVLENGTRPKSIYLFARHLGINETQFYNQFASFDKIEKSIFKAFFDNTISLLEEDSAFHSFDAQNKLISFYFTFFEVLKANRSYVVLTLEKEKNKLMFHPALIELKKAFIEFVGQLDIHTMRFKEAKMEKAKNQGLTNIFWAQLLFTLRFWLDDDSTGFSTTDIFIEKSMKTGMAFLDASTLESVIDLGKFLFKEKIMTK